MMLGLQARGGLQPPGLGSDGGGISSRGPRLALALWLKGDQAATSSRPGPGSASASLPFPAESERGLSKPDADAERISRDFDPADRWPRLELEPNH